MKAILLLDVDAGAMPVRPRAGGLLMTIKPKHDARRHMQPHECYEHPHPRVKKQRYTHGYAEGHASRSHLGHR